MKRFYPIAVHSGCRGYDIGNQPSVEWQRPVTLLKLVIYQILLGDVDWIHLAQGEDQWHAVVNTLTKLGVAFRDKLNGYYFFYYC
jgi:hypothetical protein